MVSFDEDGYPAMQTVVNLVDLMTINKSIET